MRKYSSIFIGLGALFLISCASSEMAGQNVENGENEESGESANQELIANNAANNNDPNEIICRREIVTGTNFRRQVCLTRAQRGGMRAESREDFNERRSGTLGAAVGAPEQ